MDWLYTGGLCECGIERCGIYLRWRRDEVIIRLTVFALRGVGFVLAFIEFKRFFSSRRRGIRFFREIFATVLYNLLDTLREMILTFICS